MDPTRDGRLTGEPLEPEKRTFGPPTPAALPERVYAKVRFIPTSVAFAWACLRGRPFELWIGDSHAMTFNRDIVNSHFLRAAEGQFIARAGARLMYSIGRNGFPPLVVRVAKFARRVARGGTVVPFFVAGEIDVRAHLVAHPDRYDFVAAYVARCVTLAREMNARKCYLVVPPPPVNLIDSECWYPIVGTVAERVAAHDRLRSELHRAVAGSPFAEVLDFTPLLAATDGSMPTQFTDDGCHTNADRVTLIRARVAQLQLVRRH